MNTFKKGDVIASKLGQRATVKFIDGPYVYHELGYTHYFDCTLVPQITAQPKFKIGDRVVTSGVDDAGPGTVIGKCDWSKDHWSVKFDSWYGVCGEAESALTLVSRSDSFAAAVAAPKATPKFKVGDRVEVKNDLGDVGVILSHNNGKYAIQFESQYPAISAGAFIWSEGELIATPSSPTIVIRRDPGKGYRPNDNPRVHNSVAEATKEAERLAKANPGVEFATFSLASTSTATAPTVTTVAA